MVQTDGPSKKRREALKAHSNINELPQQSVALEKYYNLAGQCQAKANAATEKALRMPARTYLEAHRRQVPLDQAYCYQRRYATLGMECIPKHGYYNSKLGPQRASLKSGCLGALAWLEKIVDAMDADEVLLGAHRAAVAALKKREAEEAALKQGMARLQRDRAEREKMKQKRAASAARFC